jgi:hypothetical protein
MEQIKTNAPLKYITNLFALCLKLEDSIVELEIMKTNIPIDTSWKDTKYIAIHSSPITSNIFETFPLNIHEAMKGIMNRMY